MRWAMSSTASGGIAVMYLTCSLGWAGGGSVFHVVVLVALGTAGSTTASEA